jgi:transitional endoplasmic reticulum ATPase
MAPAEEKKKVNLIDPSGAEIKNEDDVSTAILKKKKKPNQLMFVPYHPSPRSVHG